MAQGREAGRRVGPYELLERLGQGAMGEVWRARHVELGAVRALKRTLRQDAQFVARFEREGRALAVVRHPSVVAVHEVGREPDGTAWLAMELVEGEPLDQLLARGPLPLARALEVAAQLARGLEALHAAGVVHRDLKPANVVVGRDGRAVLLDLGVALSSAERERLTLTGALVGTPAYMAPEQLAGGEVGPPSDVHALGLVLFELVTGRAARDGADLVTLARRPVERLSSVDDGLPAALDALVARTTDVDPRLRPTAGALAEDLDAIGRRPGPTSRARRGRGRLGLGLLGLGLAVAARVTPWRGEAPGPAPPSSPAGVAAPATAPATVDALRSARRLPPAARRSALVTWLAAHPDHPARPEAEALLAPLLRDGPRWSQLRPAACAARFLDGATVVVGDGRSLVLLDAASGEPRGAVPLPGVALDLARVPGAPPRVLVTTGAPNGLLLVDPATGEVRPLPWSPRLVPEEVAVSASGGRALVDVRDGAPHLLELPGGRLVAELLGHEGPVVSVRFGGARPLTGSGATFELGRSTDNALRVWSPEGALLHRVTTFSKTNDAAPVPGTNLLVVATSGGQLILVDADTAEPRGRLAASDVGADLGSQRAHTVSVRHVVVTPDGALAVSAAGDTASGPNDLAVWDLPRRALLRRVVRPSDDPRPRSTLGLDLDPVGRTVLLLDSGGALERWDLGPLLAE